MQRFFVKMTLCEGLREVNLEGLCTNAIFRQFYGKTSQVRLIDLISDECYNIHNSREKLFSIE